MFMMYLVTAILSLIAPRTQVLRQLHIGSSLVKEEDGRYWVKILADLSKNGKPTLFSIPDQLTKSFDFYINLIRPRIIKNAVSNSNKLKKNKFTDHNYLFFNSNGLTPRSEFCTYTTIVTQQLIGRPVNPHAFRSAVIQAFYESGATQNDMDVLARIMSHSSNTAKDFYYRPKMTEAAIKTNKRIAEFLLE
jgi:integrase